MDSREARAALAIMVAVVLSSWLGTFLYAGMSVYG